MMRDSPTRGRAASGLTEKNSDPASASVTNASAEVWIACTSTRRASPDSPAPRLRFHRTSRRSPPRQAAPTARTADHNAECTGGGACCSSRRSVMLATRPVFYELDANVGPDVRHTGPVSTAPTLDAVAAAATETARAAAEEASPGLVGEHLGVVADDERLVTHLF